MSIGTDIRPFVIGYDKSKDSYVIRRGSTPVHHAKTKAEAKKWVIDHDADVRALHIFFHKLKPTPSRKRMQYSLMGARGRGARA